MKGWSGEGTNSEEGKTFVPRIAQKGGCLVLRHSEFFECLGMRLGKEGG